MGAQPQDPKGRLARSRNVESEEKIVAKGNKIRGAGKRNKDGKFGSKSGGKKK